MKRAALSLLILSFAFGAQADSEYKPSPYDPKEMFKILDLVMRVESIGGVVEDLRVKESATEVRLELAADVLFDFDKADLRPAAEEVLKKALEYLAKYPAGTIRIEGHTDGKGSNEYNDRLSMRRAESVRNWFAKNGAADRKFSIKGLGARNPIAPNTKPDGSDDPEGRQKNRRVDIVISK